MPRRLLPRRALLAVLLAALALTQGCIYAHCLDPCSGLGGTGLSTWPCK
jgi:hypothetical protein